MKSLSFRKLADGQPDSRRWRRHSNLLRSTMAITEAPATTPVITRSDDERDSAVGAVPGGAAPAGVLAPGDPGLADCAPVGAAPGDDRPGEGEPDDDRPDDLAGDRDGDALGLALGGDLGLLLAPGMPTDVSTATTLPAVQDE